MLGFNRTHHMVQVVTDLEGREVKEWTRALRAKYRGQGTFTKLDWDRLLGDCQGTIDYPSALFAADLARLYPEAKVVMVNRGPEKWYESMSETVGAFKHPSLLRKLKEMYCRLVLPRMRDLESFWQEIRYAEGSHNFLTEKDKVIAFMRDKYDECRAAVPEERRIEWKVQDGWEPLCRHLGVDVPMVKDMATGEMVAAPFPKLNDREAYKRKHQRSMESMVTAANDVVFGLVGCGATAGAVAYGVYFVWKVMMRG